MWGYFYFMICVYNMSYKYIQVIRKVDHNRIIKVIHQDINPFQELAYTNTNLSLASSNDQIIFNNFFSDSIITLSNSKYNLANIKLIQELIPPTDTSLSINSIYVKIKNNQYEVYALHYGEFDDVKQDIDYITNNNLEMLDTLNIKEFPKKVSDIQEKNDEINKKENKFIILGYFKGKILDSYIFIHDVCDKHLPNKNINNLLCLFIYYLQKFSNLYDKNTNFNVELEPELNEDLTKYMDMGFHTSSDFYFTMFKPTMKLNNKIFCNSCREYNFGSQCIKFFL